MLSTILSIAGSLLQSRGGQLAMVALAAWFWASTSTSTYWKGVIAQEQAAREAAYKAEIARQEQAAKEIAANATARAEHSAAIAAEMQSIIDEYAKAPSHVTAKVTPKPDCDINSDFLGVLRKLDTTSGKAKPSTGSARLRKARRTPHR
jgi:hypothetical protein